MAKKSKRNKKDFSRRDFLKVGGAVAAGLQVGAVAGAGLAAGIRDRLGRAAGMWPTNPAGRWHRYHGRPHLHHQ